MHHPIFWNGNQQSYIDQISVFQHEHITIGNFGGASSKGTQRNEDAYIVWQMGPETVLAVLFDAHTTNESAVYWQALLLSKSETLNQICNNSVDKAIPNIQQFFLALFSDDEVRSHSRNCIGETAMLVTLQIGAYLWWLSIGDNSLYIFHKEFNELGQFKVNQRIFYQWVGNSNSLDLEVPCYTTGTLHLRNGENKILLLTDGVLEIEGRPFEDSAHLASEINKTSMAGAVESILQTVQSVDGKDNATIIGWSQRCGHEPIRPSRL